MLLKLPKNTKKIHWTRHIKEKMKEYQLSEKRLLRILKNPERKEGGNRSCFGAFDFLFDLIK